MKNARPQESGTSAGTAPFYIDSPRELRTLEVLLKHREISRHDLDHLIGAENSPDVVMRMRRKYGFDIDMEKRPFTDRDGCKVRIGWYSLSPADRPKVIASLKREA